MSPHADTEQLSAYLDGEVPTSERARVEQHLASCAECAAKKRALEGVIRSVGNLPPVTATEAERLALRRAVLDGIGARGVVRLPNRGRTWRVVGAMAGVAAVLAGVVAFATLRTQAPKAATASAAAPHTTSSPGPPNLGNDAAVRSYAASLGPVSTFLGQIHGTGDNAPQSAAVPSPTPLRAGGAPSAATAAPPAASGSAKRDSGTVPTLASCTRETVPTGAALLDATPVLYQGAPAWVISYGASSTSPGVLDRVVVDVRSQATCALLDQATLIP